jgi:hypothetical protein
MSKIYYGVKANFKDGSFCGVFFNNKDDQHDAIQNELSLGDTLAFEFVEKYGDHEDKEKVNLVDARDPRLSSDPLTALAAVMREHDLEFHTVNGITIGYADAGIIIDIDKNDPLTADDIKPEQLND